MKLAILGATGNAGSRILAEALQRGHEVTAIARHVGRVKTGDRVTARAGDINDPVQLKELLTGHDVVISSVKFGSMKPEVLIEAVKVAGVKRLLVVGGAGSLLLPSGSTVLEAPGFPDAYKPEALAGSEFLNILRSEKDLDWTFLSPSAEFAPGARTGKFRVGGDQLLVQPNGQSKISMEDFAIAMLDEIETPRHSRSRFTVGY